MDKREVLIVGDGGPSGVAATVARELRADGVLVVEAADPPLAPEKPTLELRPPAGWDRLGPRQRRAVLETYARRANRKAAKANPSSQLPPVRGFVCPKCWTRHPTPEARQACRISHHKERP